MDGKGQGATPASTAAEVSLPSQRQPNSGSDGEHEGQGAGAGAPASNTTFLVVSYLTSWEHMGVARVRCVSGCT